MHPAPQVLRISGHNFNPAISNSECRIYDSSGSLVSRLQVEYRPTVNEGEILCIVEGNGVPSGLSSTEATYTVRYV